MTDKFGIYDNGVSRYRRKYLDDIIFHIFSNVELSDDFIEI